MEQKRYKVIFKSYGLEGDKYTDECFKSAFGPLLIKCHNEFAKKCDESGITERLNSEFDKEYPNYEFKKDFFDNTEYIKFMSEGYMKYVVNDMNKEWSIAGIELFFGEELNLMLRHKSIVFNYATLEFFMKEV